MHNTVNTLEELLTVTCNSCYQTCGKYKGVQVKQSHFLKVLPPFNPDEAGKSKEVLILIEISIDYTYNVGPVIKD